LAKAGRDLDVVRLKRGEEGSVLSMFAAERSEAQQGMIPEPAERNLGRGEVCSY
jgi:hypothetical protein